MLNLFLKKVYVFNKGERHMKKVNNEFFAEVFVGVFMVAVLGLLVYFTVIISGTDVLSRTRRVPMTVKFTDVGGLKPRDSVVLRGMTVGMVKDLEIKDDYVVVYLTVRSGIVIHEGYEMTVRSTSLLGGNHLTIENGGGKALPEDTLFVGQAPINWVRDLSQVVTRLREATDDDNLKAIVLNLKAATESMRVSLANIEKGKGTLGRLMSDDETMYRDLSSAVASIRSVSEKLDKGQNSLARLVSDDGAVYNDIKNMFANLKNLSDRLEKGDGTLGKLMARDDTVYRDLRDTMASLKNVATRLEQGDGTLGMLMKDDNKVYNNLDATVANLKVVSDRLAKGQGTLGKLAADEEMYRDIHGLVKDVRQTVDNYRDTMPISAFTSLLVGGL